MLVDAEVAEFGSYDSSIDLEVPPLLSQHRPGIWQVFVSEGGSSIAGLQIWTSRP